MLPLLPVLLLALPQAKAPDANEQKALIEAYFETDGMTAEGRAERVAAFGMFVELVDHYVEGLVHVSTMADDYYRFREQAHALFGENTRKLYRLGDPVRVQIVRVDMERRQIDLGLEDVLERVRRDERGRGPARSSAKPKKDQRKGTPQQRRGRKSQRAGRSERKAGKRR